MSVQFPAESYSILLPSDRVASYSVDFRRDVSISIPTTFAFGKAFAANSKAGFGSFVTSVVTSSANNAQVESPNADRSANFFNMSLFISFLVLSFYN